MDTLIKNIQEIISCVNKIVTLSRQTFSAKILKQNIVNTLEPFIDRSSGANSTAAEKS